MQNEPIITIEEFIASVSEVISASQYYYDTRQFDIDMFFLRKMPGFNGYTYPSSPAGKVDLVDILFMNYAPSAPMIELFRFKSDFLQFAFITGAPGLKYFSIKDFYDFLILHKFTEGLIANVEWSTN